LNAAELAPSYRRLLRVPGLRPLMSSALFSRTSLMMSTVAIVLFALQRFHSPSDAGLSVLLLILPGLLVSPIAGALLDRFGRKRLMLLDLAVAASGLLVIAALAQTGHLGLGVLLLVLGVVSLTSTFSNAGSRSLFPLLVPEGLWDRANAADTIGYGVASIAGPALAGLLFVRLGGPATLAFVSLGYLLAGSALLRAREPRIAPTTSRGVLSDALNGLRYVLRNRALRWIAISVSLDNAGWGIMTVAIPLLVFRLHGDAAVVGGLFALQGLVGVPAALLAGRLHTVGKERQIMALAFGMGGAAVLVMAIPALIALTAASALHGLADGPANVAMFSLRQRSTQRAWFGRAFAVSMSLNYVGSPVGSGLAGLLINRSLLLSVIIAGAVSLVSGVLIHWRLPRQDTAGDMRRPPSMQNGADGQRRGPDYR
jgi:MFS family permease